ncbi:F0F1 ATP synthase subunit B [Pontibacter harenae]|uniref:F0F1 ATP synthase subunit B n=1 Tax=Pontibacter harenae TaxID=2894083 RepID=UPI001E2A19F1|nr:F0F1 ATP synthase subunit B [Pontibacter harenae]MCC9168446.1 F0F1 ATP synthase subunit B [Pontibacter harenae]
MELVTPGVGLVFWQVVTFLIVLFLLAKFAWTPIMKALSDREASIENALSAAERAKLEIQGLKAENEKLLAEARLERDKILKEATEAGNSIVETAKQKANEEGARMIAQAREAIETEKRAAVADMKNTAAVLAVDIAERILRKELNDKQAQQALAQEYIKEVTLN